MCTPGERVQLQREPNNPADPRAVAVLSERGVPIGYLTAERCGFIGRMLDRGREVDAIFQQATKFGAIIRVAFDGVIPMLPVEQVELVDEGREYFPDSE